MHTLLTADPDAAAAFIRRGELAAFPTETVYGLGANALNERAVRKIFEAKERPADNPLIVHLANPDSVTAVARSVPSTAQQLMDHFMPGPLTLILPRRRRVPGIVSAGLQTVGVRVPRHPTAHTFLGACSTPVAAPSANLSGRPSPTTWQAVQEDLDGRIACILQGPQTEVGLESTVIDCTQDPPVLLRAGAVALEELRRVVSSVDLASSDTSDAPSPSPGTRHRHYAPNAHVRLVEHPDEAPPEGRRAYIGLTPPSRPAAFQCVETCDSLTAYAQHLFAFFRYCDQQRVSTIYCQRVSPDGLGRALLDRIHRAAAR